jgi:tetratricopeptide (TPR) repeat protein
MIYGALSIYQSEGLCKRVLDKSFDPTASSTCDSLLANALQIDPHNLEALQCLASVRLSQEKTEEALAALLTFPPSPPNAPPARNQALVAALPLSVRLVRAKLLLECGAYHDALDVLENVLASDDSSVEGWYLMGWGWWLVAERQKEGGEVEGSEGLTWEDIARDSRDCLETCQMVSLPRFYASCKSHCNVCATSFHSLRVNISVLTFFGSVARVTVRSRHTYIRTCPRTSWHP